MKTSVVEVSGFLSALSSRGVDKRLMRLPGVHHVEANYVAGSATVTYDEKATDLKAIKAAIEACGMFAPPQPPFGLEMNLWLFFFATGAVIYPSWPFFVAAWRALKNGVLNMATLVVLSVGTGYLFSVGATFLYKGEQFFEAASVLLVFILLGHWLEMRARAGASDAIRALMDLAPPKATVLRDGREVEVPTAEVKLGQAAREKHTRQSTDLENGRHSHEERIFL